MRDGDTCVSKSEVQGVGGRGWPEAEESSNSVISLNRGWGVGLTMWTGAEQQSRSTSGSRVKLVILLAEEGVIARRT
jgi:hypothetical protein